MPRRRITGMSLAEMEAEGDRLLSEAAQKKERRKSKKLDEAANLDWLVCLHGKAACHACEFTTTGNKSHTPEYALKRHYAKVHGVVWPKNMGTRMEWMPSKVPEDDYGAISWWLQRDSKMQEEWQAVQGLALKHFVQLQREKSSEVRGVNAEWWIQYEREKFQHQHALDFYDLSAERQDEWRQQHEAALRRRRGEVADPAWDELEDDDDDDEDGIDWSDEEEAERPAKKKARKETGQPSGSGSSSSSKVVKK